ncbi:type III restriction-modification system endonuclease [Priestia flexa]|uniref:type III restriction-modification system endonuclease n=1 Tax=Priestia flexa TaxID=86664 RepID=UPI001EF6731A|nr:type III restriction-modification system endonuclease [Priestia flexa]MCG7314791.1 type III restriction-modification system endonuclease [Priestia flexa]
MAMELKELDYQVEAIEAVADVFKGVPLNYISNKANPVFNLTDTFVQDKLRANITTVQKNNGIHSDLRTSVNDGILGIDVKMETGTGKTYVYSRLMLELQAQYKFNKFIIVTPTTPIKEGTKAFLESDMFKRHYTLYEDYKDLNISLEVLNKQKNNSKGRRYIPSEVRNFSEGDRFAKNTVYVFLTGMAMLKKGKNSTLDRKDYDETLLTGTTRPIEAMAETRPIVILDEAHRFPRDQNTYQYITENLNPLMIIRFGATFPKITSKKNDDTRDYNNLVYNLTSAQAFNRDLVKGVSIFNPEVEGVSNTRYRLISIDNKGVKANKKIRFRNEDTRVDYDLTLGDGLNVMSEDFSNISIVDINKFDELNGLNGIKLSNERILAVGDSLYAGVFSHSYQEIMIDQAIELHMQKEKENFYRSPRYKTLALFFIDNRFSYRTENDDAGPLRLYFENKLEKRIKKEIADIEGKSPQGANDKEYVEYLKASLDNISLTNAGYFSKDNDSSDEGIQKEVDEILRDKEGLLSFREENGNWNVRRFIFSKWTLREGWDNPNVFTIAKLRSSGSENSKIQEVGRGLRLPVDENGNRAEIGQDEFRLNYLVDHTENKFAEKLQSEINEGEPNATNIMSMMDEVAEKMGKDRNALFFELGGKNYIDMNGNINLENRAQFYEEYPLFRVGVKSGKVRKGNPEKIGIRKENYAKLKELWENINQNYMVQFEPISDDVLEQGIEASLTSDIFDRQKSSFVVHNIIKDEEKGNRVEIEKEKTKESYYLEGDKIGYGEFLKKLCNRLNIPVGLLHKGIINFHKKYPKVDIYPTNYSIETFVSNFEDWFINQFEGKYSYRRIPNNVKETSLTDNEGNPKDSITQAMIGVMKSNKENKVPDTFLYDKIVFDSPFEETNIIDGETKSVEVYGKIPKRSIRVPMYFGGTSSPDFMYVVKKTDGSEIMNLIIETKDVKKWSDLREVEKSKIKASQKFFEELQNEIKEKDENFEITYKSQLHNDKIQRILERISNEEK